MEKLPLYLIMLIVYVIAVSGGRKKKKKRRDERAARSPDVRAAQMREERAAKRKEARSRLEQRRQRSRGFADAFAASEDEQMSPAASQMSGGRGVTDLSGVPEGEDLCHPGKETHRPDDALWQDAHGKEDAAPETDGPWTQGGALGQEVLRGVIMSEILTRPCERRARSRQGYHG